jgi:hypothetical protein
VGKKGDHAQKMNLIRVSRVLPSPIQENTSCILASGSAGSAKFGLIARWN